MAITKYQLISEISFSVLVVIGIWDQSIVLVLGSTQTIFVKATNGKTTEVNKPNTKKPSVTGKKSFFTQ